EDKTWAIWRTRHGVVGRRKHRPFEKRRKWFMDGHVAANGSEWKEMVSYFYNYCLFLDFPFNKNFTDSDIKKTKLGRYGNDEGEACQFVVRGRYVGLRQRCFVRVGIVKCHHESSRNLAGKCAQRQGTGSYYTFIDISGGSGFCVRYDSLAGFCGVMKQPCLDIIPPFIIEFDHPMPTKCAAGNTGVFVNRRELNQKDLDLLAGRGLPTTKDRSYIIDISGKVVDEDTNEELDCLGKLAPTVENVKHGFGMKVPKVVPK
ncbi:hypothetical protein Tco_0822036, partial [Tanacetum coccineum]